MNKPYKLGILVGRFQMMHSGHEQMIRTAIALCDRVGVFVGSSQESGTRTNPFSYDTRKALLNDCLGGDVDIYPLPDIGVGNTARWGEYVIQNVVKRFGMKPDLLVTGKESRRKDWFDGMEGVSIAELYVPKTIDISASRMRSFLEADDFESWKLYVNPAIWNRYPVLRKEVLLSLDNIETQSI